MASKSLEALKEDERLAVLPWETGYKLLKMGIETVRRLNETPEPMMFNLLGKNGIELHKKANGLGESPVVPYREQKSISTEQTFEKDTIDMQFINAQLVRMTESIAFELRKQNKLTWLPFSEASL